MAATEPSCESSRLPAIKKWSFLTPFKPTSGPGLDSAASSSAVFLSNPQSGLSMTFVQSQKSTSKLQSMTARKKPEYHSTHT